MVFRANSFSSSTLRYLLQPFTRTCGRWAIDVSTNPGTLTAVPSYAPV
jgi:hypothetical protein